MGHSSWWLPWAEVSAVQPLMAVWPLWVWLTGPWTPLSLLSAAFPTAGCPCLGHVQCRESGRRCRSHVGFCPETPGGCPGGNRNTCSECEHQWPAAAVTKYHRQLKPRSYRPQSWRPADLGFFRGLCCWLADRVFSRCPLMAVPLCVSVSQFPLLIRSPLVWDYGPSV